VDDNKVIEAAVAGNANYVVTGDDDLLSLKQFGNIRFVQPKEFLEIIDAKA
jgi:predicted nucleic acid-binding protein